VTGSKEQLKDPTTESGQPGQLEAGRSPETGLTSTHQYADDSRRLDFAKQDSSLHPQVEKLSRETQMKPRPAIEAAGPV
jgi:hypothetical protein